MTNEIKEKALSAFLKNPYWEGVYKNAPEKAKRFYEIVFANSKDLISQDEHVKSVHELYGQFDDDDWDYIIEHTQNNMGKWGYRKARERFGKKKNEDQQ